MKDMMVATAKQIGLDPEKSARAIFDEPWDGSFPVDPIVIADQLGIRVLAEDLPSDISGALIKRLGQDPTIIVLNKRDSRNRKRFTCAHEIGHYIHRLETNSDH